MDIVAYIDNWLSDIKLLEEMAQYSYKDKNFDTLQACNEDLQIKLLYIKDSYLGFQDKYIKLIDDKVAFTPINDISKFITESICDIDARIDTTKMQGDVRDYQLQLKLAEDIEKKIILLNNIHEAYLSMTQTLSTVKMQEYIVARAGYKANTEKLNSLYANLSKNKKEIVILNQYILQSDKVITIRYF